MKLWNYIIAGLDSEMNSTKTITVVSSPVNAVSKSLALDWSIDEERDLNDHNKLRFSVLYDRDNAQAACAANKLISIVHSIICTNSDYESIGWLHCQYNLTTVFHTRVVCFHNNSLKPSIAKLNPEQTKQLLKSNASVNRFLKTYNDQSITQLKWDVY